MFLVKYFHRRYRQNEAKKFILEYNRKIHMKIRDRDLIFYL